MEINIETFAWNWSDIVDEAFEKGFKEPEKMARLAFEKAGGRSITTVLDSMVAACDESELMTVREQLKGRLDRFAESYGKQPNYAQVTVRWNGQNEDEEHSIALNRAAGSFADDEVMFTCESPEEFLTLATPAKGRDFTVTGISGYSLGTFDEYMQRQMQASRIIGVERENDWQGDRYVVFNRADGTADGCYVKPDGVIYDSLRGLNGQNLADILGKAAADRVMDMREFEKLDLSTSLVSDVNNVTDMVVRRVGVFPYEKGMLRCKINGEQQSWRDITLHEYRKVTSAPDRTARETVKLALVNKYFVDELRQRTEQQQSSGIKR